MVRKIKRKNQTVLTKGFVSKISSHVENDGVADMLIDCQHSVSME